MSALNKPQTLCRTAIVELIIVIKYQVRNRTIDITDTNTFISHSS